MRSINNPGMDDFDNIFSVFGSDIKTKSSSKKENLSNVDSDRFDDPLDHQHNYSSHKQRQNKDDLQDSNAMDYDDHHNRFKRREDDHDTYDHGDDYMEDELIYDKFTPSAPPLCSKKKVVFHKNTQKKKKSHKSKQKVITPNKNYNGPVVKDVTDMDSDEIFDSPLRKEPDPGEDFFGVSYEQKSTDADNNEQQSPLYQDPRSAPGFDESRKFVVDFSDLADIGGDKKKSKKPKKNSRGRKTQFHKPDSNLGEDNINENKNQSNDEENNVEDISYSTYSQHPVKFDSARECSNGFKKFQEKKSGSVTDFEDFVISKTGYGKKPSKNSGIDMDKNFEETRKETSCEETIPEKSYHDSNLQTDDSDPVVIESPKRTQKNGNFSKSHESISKMFHACKNQSSPTSIGSPISASPNRDDEKSKSSKSKNRDSINDDDDDESPNSSEDPRKNILNKFNYNYIKSHFSIYMNSTGRTVDDLLRDTCPMCSFGGLNMRGRIGIEIERTKQIYRKKAASSHNKSLSYLLSQMWNTRVFDLAVKLNIPMLPLTVDKAYEHVSKPHIIDRIIVAKSDISKLNDIEEILCDRLFFVKSTVKTKKLKTEEGQQKLKTVTDSELTYRPNVLRDILLVLERKRRLMLVRRGDSVFTTSSKKILTGSDNSQLRIKFG